MRRMREANTNTERTEKKWKSLSPRARVTRGATWDNCVYALEMEPANIHSGLASGTGRVN